MNERLIIRDFGPIKDILLELRTINLLIGDQGTGKSTVAKLMIALKEMLSIDDRNHKDTITDWNLIAFKDQLSTIGLVTYLKPGSYIEFRNGRGSFIFDNSQTGRDKIKILSKETQDKTSYVQGFIPAYREAAILLKDSLNAMVLAGAQLPKLFYSFGQQLANAKKSKTQFDYSELLGVKYEFEQDDDIIIMKDGKRISLDESSGAIKSGVPMLLVFDFIVSSIRPERSSIQSRRVYHHKNRPYIIIEEPELNCFPSTQKKLVDYFISKLKYEGLKEYYCRLMITTHSPYFLTSLNNLMYAYTVGQKHPEKINAIIDEKFWLNPDDVAVYMLTNDGKCADIVDREANLIMAEEIDKISRDLNETFEKISDIEFVPI